MIHRHTALLITMTAALLIATNCFALSSNEAKPEIAQPTKSETTDTTAVVNNTDSGTINNTENNTTNVSSPVNQAELTDDILQGDNINGGFITYDPYEKFNRAIFKFNRGVDKVFVRPLALTYNKVLPDFAQKGISNFFTNVAVIPSIVNDLLQLNFIRAISDTWRLAINTTVGVGGLVDVAGKLGLEPGNNSLSLTFMKWGTKKTPYFVIPFLGPSTFRDAIGLTIDYELFSIYPHINPQMDRYAILTLWYIDIRDKLLKGDKIVDDAYDPYILVRNAYLQHREYLFNQVTGNTAFQEEETTKSIVH